MLSLPDQLSSLAERAVPWRRLRAVARALAFVLVTGLLLALFILAGVLGRFPKAVVRRLWCRFCLRLLGVEVHYRGEPMRACATLFLANHVSYLDILLLGARTDATFIAKAEVAAWPLFGTIGRAARTFFIRRRWRDALIQRNTLAAQLRHGESFILFAEGTSSSGLDVLPLKTSLLSVAEPWVIDRPIAVQPVALAYRHLADGTPITIANCSRYAWFGDAEMVPHLWSMLHDDGCVVEVVFGEPVMSWAVTSRKSLGPAMRDSIRTVLALKAAHGTRCGNQSRVENAKLAA
jgi:1-acyl-sn-glycerol-3-phosphate acyltransferase